ncbi:iron(III) transport system substrate-binding protein [Rhizobium cellulosilyticum]|uniref:Iron(III) transport system substrate-binding protein n=1 Tax=Aliirhizobium cellulosilyticum TaxID=393664 RepID=A0A7W6UWK9_9HYPH|nr:iron ABC transporter substrate-binding protein [Rhizobium cellulosilyticum]MBB4346723.1 iron(III) transport system substrate-binding protein [Rhizobium cellulosilyticum]MBB4410883.1 iron(III) transport system substrate-binding protein [Rhizobium cellulosilyticum]MBB4445571.1 iron(III) transport system substrate-binding protein [Rhizobium cellulosilyticum]
MKTSSFLAGVAPVFSVFAISVLSLSSPASAQVADSLTIYNAQHEVLTKEWVDAFTEETGIVVTVRNGGDMEIANQIVQEGANSPADVFLTENSPAMALVDGKGLFEPIDKATLDQVPEQFRPANGHWTGIAARSTVFAYDKTKLSEDKLPKSLLDLAKPEWKGRWAASPSGADFQAIVGALLQLKGEEATAAWLKGMKENFTSIRGNSTAMKAVNAGQIEGAVIYHYYYFGDQAKTGENSKNVSLHYFKNQDPGAFVSISGGGILASSKHKQQAQAFLKWVAGKSGQKILRDGTSFEYAVGEDEASNKALVPLADLQAPKVEPTELNNAKVTDMLTAAGIL